MIYPFHVTYDNMFHYTTESILPILDYRPVMEEGDTVLVPDFPPYPIDLVKRMVPDGVDVIVTPAHIPRKFMSCYMAASGAVKVRELCKQMMSYLWEHKVIPGDKPILYMSFRLHTRRWLPISNIQNLVDNLKEKYTILLNLNPICEKISNMPIITGVTEIFNLSYEEQLSYAAASDFAIFGNGAGMIFPRIAGLSSVMITPCLVTETAIVGPYYGTNMVVVSDKQTDTNVAWNFDIEKVSVASVLEAFNECVKLPGA